MRLDPDNRRNRWHRRAAGALLCFWLAIPGGTGRADPGTTGVSDAANASKKVAKATKTATTPASATASETTVKKKAPDKKLVPWRGSEFVYTNSVSAVSLDQSLDLTYNPYYAMTFSFRPWWWFNKNLFVRAWLDVERELTQSDVTTYSGEAWVGDLKLSTGLSRILTIPKAKIAWSFALVLTLPTSKASQARSLILGVGLQVGASRTFKVLKGLSLGYTVRGTPTFHRYTVSQRETPLVPGCNQATGGCDAFYGMGLRNRVMRVTHFASASLQILKWLGVALSVGQSVDWLYPLGDSPEEVSLQTVEPQNKRYITFFDISVNFSPLKMLGISLGYSAVHPQLAPDSSYYVPFFNRYSALYLALSLKIDGLVERIQRSVK